MYHLTENEMFAKTVTLSDAMKAHKIFNDLNHTDNLGRLGAIFRAGVIEGKRQDRARRKGGVRQ